MNEDLISKLDWDDLLEKEDRARSMGRMMDEPHWAMRRGFWKDEPEEEDERE